MHSNTRNVDRGLDVGVDAAARDLARRFAEASQAVARAQAAQARVLADAADLGMQRVAELVSTSSREAELPLRALAAELSVAANMSDRTVQRRMNDAATLAEAFPATFDAWDAGRVSAGHVAVIMEHGLSVTDAVARADFEREALVRAEGDAGAARVGVGAIGRVSAAPDVDGATPAGAGFAGCVCAGPRRWDG